MDMPPSRFVWKDDCEPLSPIRKLSVQRASDRVVILNTHHSLLVDESDTEAEDEDEDEEDGGAQEDSFEQAQAEEQSYHEQLVNLNFRLEMEEHARAADEESLEIPKHSQSSEFNALHTVTSSSGDEDPQHETAVSTQKVSIFDTVTDSLVDTLCFPRKACGMSASRLPAPTSTSPVMYERSVQQDILQVMGCSNPPDEDEIANLWDMDTTLQFSCNLPTASPARLAYPPVPSRPTGPHRPGPRERVLRLRKWRQERSLPVLGPPDRTHSVDIMEIEHSLSTLGGENDLTYDSDPEMSVSMRAQKSPKQKSLLPKSPATPKRRSGSSTLRWRVRESMNQTWDLVWHTEKASKTVRAYMERGTIVSGQMLEPSLVWRHSKKECTQLRFLNICRILAATPQDQRRACILARPSCTLRLMTSTGDEYFLEAPSASACTTIIDTWKLCIARFATLAVLEDLDSIQKEFFHATSHSFVPDMEEIMDDLERDAKNDV